MNQHKQCTGGGMEQKETKDNVKKSIFRKLSIFILCLIMLGIVGFSFFFGTPLYLISDGIIYIFLIIVFLIIQESFETLSIGSLIHFKKEAKEKSKEAERLNNENRELRHQFSSIIANSINNNNKMYNVFSDSFLANMRVESATENEKERKDDFETEILDSQANYDEQRMRSVNNRRRYTREVKKLALEKFIKNNDIKNDSWQTEVKFSESFIGTDPIMERNIIFAAYIKRPIDEVFIEVSSNPDRFDMDFKLYYMISKIYHYSSANQTKAKLILVIPKLPPTNFNEYSASLMNQRDSERSLERFNKNYSPAIKNGLLEIVEIEITEDDFKAIESENIEK
jgi:hypothetical protein